jgi:hypothetical protein
MGGGQERLGSAMHAAFDGGRSPADRDRQLLARADSASALFGATLQ